MAKTFWKDPRDGRYKAVTVKKYLMNDQGGVRAVVVTPSGEHAIAYLDHLKDYE